MNEQKLNKKSNESVELVAKLAKQREPMEGTDE